MLGVLRKNCDSRWSLNIACDRILLKRSKKYLAKLFRVIGLKLSLNFFEFNLDIKKILIDSKKDVGSFSNTFRYRILLKTKCFKNICEHFQKRFTDKVSETLWFRKDLLSKMFMYQQKILFIDYKKCPQIYTKIEHFEVKKIKIVSQSFLWLPIDFINFDLASITSWRKIQAPTKISVSRTFILIYYCNCSVKKQKNHKN